MDALTALVEIFKSGVWPLVVYLIYRSQKAKIGAMLEDRKITRAEMGKSGLRFETEAAISKGEKLADVVTVEVIEAQRGESKSPATIAAMNAKANLILDYRPEGARSPADIVEAAWQHLYAILKEFMEKTEHLGLGSNLHMEIVVTAAGMVDEISVPVAKTIHQLYRTRNLIRIDPMYEPSFEDAERYAESANKVIYALIFGLESPVKGN